MHTDQPIMTAAQKVQKALMHLVLHKPFFGSLVLRLKVGPDRQGHPTCWTDGRALRYNPEFVAAKLFDELCFILAHEVGHCALAHPYRRGDREGNLFNDACDHAVNSLLVEDGSFSMPANALYDLRFKDMHAEAIYAVLLRERDAEEQQQQGGVGSAGGEGKSQQGTPAKSEQSKKSGDPDGTPAEDAATDGENEQQSDDSGASEGEQDEPGDESQQDGSLADAPGTEHGDVLDAGTSGPKGEEGEGIEDSGVAPSSLSEAEQQQEMQEWLAAAAAAAMEAEAMGNMAASAKRVIENSFAPMQTYAEYLRLFCSRFSKDEESWSRASRRTLAQGLYLPSQRSEAVGKLVVVIDTSGSISKRDLAHFEAEMQAIHAELRAEELIVLYCDARVHSEQRIGRFDEVKFDLDLVKGGGGTDFRPPFKWVHVAREQEAEDIVGLIYVTDLEGRFPQQNEEWFDPELPVLWVASEKLDVPFGEVCYLFNK